MCVQMHSSTTQPSLGAVWVSWVFPSFWIEAIHPSDGSAIGAKKKEGHGGEMLGGKPSHSRNLCAHEIADVQTLLPLAWSNLRGPFCKELEQLRVHVNSHAEEGLLSDKLFHIEGEEEAGESGRC